MGDNLSDGFLCILARVSQKKVSRRGAEGAEENI